MTIDSVRTATSIYEQAMYAYRFKSQEESQPLFEAAISSIEDAVVGDVSDNLSTKKI